MAACTLMACGLRGGRAQVGISYRFRGQEYSRRAFAVAPRFHEQLTTAGRRHRYQQQIVAAASAGTVRIIIQGRRIEVTDAIKDYVERKISKAVEKYESQVKEVDVNLSVRGGDTGTKGDRQQKSEVTVRTLRNGIVRSEVVAETMYASIDGVCDKVQRKLRKVKEKAIAKGKWPGGGGPKGGPKVGTLLEKDGEPIPLDKEVEIPPEIVRMKYFRMEPMSDVEAIDQMQRLEHNFYVYRDKNTSKIQVVYKRQEHGYGVIIPINDEEGSEV